ncbi:MAG: HAMP domain-containing sensor histidine kinase [Bacillota bacterium]|nr:HAMP domain-containing sensor histidine kinase [Bacillota bacterium]
MDLDKTGHAKEVKSHSGIKRRWLLNSLSFVAGILAITIAALSLWSVAYYYSSVTTNLTKRVQTTAKFMNRFLNKSYVDFYQNAEKITRDFADKDKLDLQIIDSYGRIMFSSSDLTSGLIPATSDVEQSLAGQSIAVFTGRNSLSDERVMSVSSPLYFSDGRIIGAVRCVTSLKTVERQIITTILLVIAVASLILSLVIISNRYFIRSILHPILRLNEAAKEIAKGHYNVRLEKEFNDEIGELCDTINFMSEEINRAEKVKNDFISSVSHELRTPLTAIGGWSETLMADGLGNVNEAMHGLEIINKEAGRLSQMVEELLSFSRIESGDLKLRVEPFDLCGELSDAIYIYSDILRRESIELSYEEPDEQVIINGDRDRLKQVFINIIDNAAKYGREGGKIEIRAKVENGNAAVSIRDFGVGIPAEELPFVKDKFYKGSSKRKGTGIGLAVCDEIVRVHGGSLEIQSKLGEGTTAVITLPLYVPPTLSAIDS